ncbi:MAG: hypothetical protein ABL977_09120 [Candidatus Eisenbacteria bacterium]
MYAPLTDLAFERLRRLPQRDDVFELAVVRLPRWVVPPDEPPYRPWVSVARSRREGTLADGEVVAPAERERLNLLDAIGKLAAHRSTGHRPRTVEVRDAALVEPLRAQLAPLEIDVALVPRLPLIDELEADMLAEFVGDEPEKGYLAGVGVTLEHVRAFADAALQFHASHLWWHLGDYDLVCLESQVPAREFTCVSVLSGLDGELGLAFFDSVREHADYAADRSAGAALRRRARWSCTFDPVYELPNPDSDLWEQHGLPVAGPESYPMLGQFGPEQYPVRANAEQLVFVEGLLRALAATTEAELDSGRWRHIVSTHAGPREYAFALPSVLTPSEPRLRPADPRAAERMLVGREHDRHALPGESGASASASPREQALAKYHDALEAQDRLRLKLAREAIALYSDLSDAWLLVAEDMPDSMRALELHRHALAAAERDLGPEGFARYAGEFWLALETRPYMRALMGLASIEYEAELEADAFTHWSLMLQHDPDDRLGARMVLVPRLLVARRDDEAAALLERYAEDPSAILAFASAILAFRRNGPGEVADAALAKATQANRHALKHLLADEPPEVGPDDGYYTPGDEHEALIIADELYEAYEGSMGAAEWLRAHRRDAKKARKKK